MAYVPKNMSDKCFLSDEIVSNGLKSLRLMIVGGICADAWVKPKHCLSAEIFINNYDRLDEQGILKVEFDEKTKAKIQKVTNEEMIDMLKPKETAKLKEFLPKIEDNVNKTIEKLRGERQYKIARLEALIQNIENLPNGLTSEEMTKLDGKKDELETHRQKLAKLEHFKLIRKPGKLAKLKCTFNYVYWLVCIEYAMDNGQRETIVYPTENPKYLEWIALAEPRPIFLKWIAEEMKKEDIE